MTRKAALFLPGCQPGLRVHLLGALTLLIEWNGTAWNGMEWNETEQNRIA